LIAFDTNILIYASEMDDPEGRNLIALGLMDKVAARGAIVPLQVVGEYINACRRKQVSSLQMACERANLWMDIYVAPATKPNDYIEAAGLLTSFNLQYFDALILTVARNAGAMLLLSEDMQDGLEVEGLKIVNPFVATNETLLADYFGSAL
jgi:predicted nucleic acid-binding protein